MRRHEGWGGDGGGLCVDERAGNASVLEVTIASVDGSQENYFVVGSPEYCHGALRLLHLDSGTLD